MKFDKWRQSQKAEGPTKAMVASKRFAFDLTPEEVALAIIFASFAVEGDGTDLDDLLSGHYDPDTGGWTPAATTEEVRAFVAKHLTKKQTDELTKAVLFEVGLGEHTYLTIVESRSISKDYITAVAMGVVDLFVDDDTIDRLFGGAA